MSRRIDAPPLGDIDIGTVALDPSKIPALDPDPCLAAKGPSPAAAPARPLPASAHPTARRRRLVVGFYACLAVIGALQATALAYAAFTRTAAPAGGSRAAAPPAEGPAATPTGDVPIPANPPARPAGGKVWICPIAGECGFRKVP